jgi:hypothetical protein
MPDVSAREVFAAKTTMSPILGAGWFRVESSIVLSTAAGTVATSRAAGGRPASPGFLVYIRVSTNWDATPFNRETFLNG